QLHLQAANGPVDSTKVYADTLAALMQLKLPPNTYPEAGFGHLMGGYDAGYYGYLWSEVYAADMFTRFSREGLKNAEAGIAYRQAILEPGGTEDPMILIQRFLGREPNQKAFLRNLGLDQVM